MNQEVFDKSIVMIGPIGAGKSFLGKALSRKTSLPYFALDELRTLAHADKIEEEFSRNDVPEEERERHMRHWSHQRELRKRFPDLPNYFDFGFDMSTSKAVKVGLGEIAWHLYQKGFETRLLNEFIMRLEKPGILDMGGGMAVSLDDDYEKLLRGMSESQRRLYLKHLTQDEHVGFNKVFLALAPFKNIVQLKLPADYKETHSKASKNSLNDAMIASRQFDLLARFTVSTDGLIYNNGKESVGDEKRAGEIADEILEKVQMPCKAKETKCKFER